MKERIEVDLGRITDLLDRFAADAQHNLQGVSESIGQRLNLVNREEFEIQKALVEKLRQQLDQLQLRLDQLEK
ncbi:MAG: accessory factor UbiK family protein [Immundisolibacteraceae bacterium]|nr:accessory factor UbiK family protein [Immundisolibacteraceae bacterium]